MAWLFVNDQTRQAIVEANPSFDEIQALRGRGFELIRDFGTEKDCYEYAELYCEGFRYECKFCGFFTSVLNCSGQRYSGYHAKWIVFRNTKICEQCQQGDDVKISNRRTKA